jgi:HEAT repeat protein
VPISQRDRVRQLVVALANEKSPDLIRRQLQALSGYGAALVPLLEQIAVEEKLYLREDIYSEVLPPLDPAFQALALLRSGDVNQRRSASNRLANEFQEHPPSALALTRLAQLMPGESDAVVWLNLWRALFDRDDEPLCELAYVGLEHAVPEVRRQSCQYLGRHPAPRHAAALMRAIDDPAPEVARAATEALGHCGPLADRRRLAQALASRDPGLRFAAAVSLARLDDESGRAALERFTYEGDSDLRRETAQAMGQVADKRFIPALIRLLDDRDSVRLAALVALGAIAGGERIQEPAERSLSLDEQARRWQNWWRAKQQQGD